MIILTTCFIDRCSGPVRARGLCSAHYRKWQKYGDPSVSFRPSRSPHQSETAEDRFWSLVDKSGECWLWMGPRNRDGYGFFGFSGIKHRAHRFAYALAHGPIPSGLLVCHHCDNPPCVNAAHLFLGTDYTNAMDRVAKGRGAVGCKNGQAKLDEQRARAIHSRYQRGGVTMRALAVEYGVSVKIINDIVHRRYWKTATSAESI